MALNIHRHIHKKELKKFDPITVGHFGFSLGGVSRCEAVNAPSQRSITEYGASKITIRNYWIVYKVTKIRLKLLMNIS